MLTPRNYRLLMSPVIVRLCLLVATAVVLSGCNGDAGGSASTTSTTAATAASSSTTTPNTPTTTVTEVTDPPGASPEPPVASQPIPVSELEVVAFPVPPGLMMLPLLPTEASGTPRKGLASWDGSIRQLVRHGMFLSAEGRGRTA